ncbi:MAG: hypothetical protein ACXWHZ_10620 [Usitatibacter sp.]
MKQLSHVEVQQVSGGDYLVPLPPEPPYPFPFPEPTPFPEPQPTPWPDVLLHGAS